MVDAKEERRTLERVKIKGAAIFYRFANDLKLVKRYLGPEPLEDLTWSSLRFATDKSIQPGEILDVEIAIPGESRLRVRGCVIWISDLPIKEKFYAVVQFLAYGTTKPYNSIKIKERLKQIVDKYSRIVH
jgi:hypothetical protein